MCGKKSGLDKILFPANAIAGNSKADMGSSAKEIYRNLLKAVRKHIGKEQHKSHFADYIKGEFRRNTNSENLKLAHNYTFYLNSVHHHKDLLFSYNIAVDRSEEVKRVLGKSAASVGLRLPEVYES